jgi:hypothetical protein
MKFTITELFTVAFYISMIASFLTHISWTLYMLMGSEEITAKIAVIMLAGTFFPPFGVLHGFWLWF